MKLEGRTKGKMPGKQKGLQRRKLQAGTVLLASFTLVLIMGGVVQHQAGAAPTPRALDTFVEFDTTTNAIYARGQAVTFDNYVLYDSNGAPVKYVDKDDNQVSAPLPQEYIWRPLALYGGWREGTHTGNTSLTLTSGTIARLFGGNESGSFTGSSHIALNGGMVKEIVAGGNKSGNFSGSSAVTVDGAKIDTQSVLGYYTGLFGGSYDGSFSGDAQVTATSGSIKSATAFAGGNAYGTFVGTTTLNLAAAFENNGGLYGGNVGTSADKGTITFRGNSYLVIDGDALVRSVFGANLHGDFVYEATTRANDGYATKVIVRNNKKDSSVHGGGAGVHGEVSDVYGNTYVEAENSSLMLYGGGGRGDVYGDTEVHARVSNSRVVAGGGEYSGVKKYQGSGGNTQVFVDASTVEDVYGGGNSGADLANGTNASIEGTARTLIDSLGIGTSTIVDLYAGTYSGHSSTVVHEAIATIYGGQVSRVFGSSWRGVTQQVKLNVQGGLVGSIFSGGTCGGTVWLAEITVAAGVVNNVYGGSYSNSGDTSGSLVEQATINAKGGTIGFIYGGGFGNGAVVNETTEAEINLVGATVGTVFGGGYIGTELDTTTIKATAGTITWIYGGGDGGLYSGYNQYYSAEVKETTISLEGASITGGVFGGGSGSGCDVEQSSIKLSAGTVGGNIYMGGFQGSAAYTNREVCVDQADFLFTGGTFSRLYMGGYTTPTLASTAVATVDEATADFQATPAEGSITSNLIFGHGLQASDTVDRATIKVHKIKALDYRFYLTSVTALIADNEIVNQQDEVAEYDVVDVDVNTDNIAIASPLALLRPYKLYAEFSTVTYNAGGGTGTMASKQIKTGKPYTVLPNGFTRLGYRFVSWEATGAASGSFDAGDVVAALNGDITLTAVWEKEKITPPATPDKETPNIPGTEMSTTPGKENPSNGTSQKVIKEKPQHKKPGNKGRGEASNVMPKTGETSILFYLLLAIFTSLVGVTLAISQGKKKEADKSQK